MKNVLGLALALLMAQTTTLHASDSFPTKPIRIILPTSAGGASEAATRLHSEHVSGSLGVPVIVESRPGGSGAIAATTVLRAPADGHTLLFAESLMYSTQAASSNTLPFDPSEDIKAVTSLYINPLVLAVPAGLGVESIEELVTLAKKSEEGLTYGTQYVGGPGHLLGARLANAAEVKMRMIPYNGGPPMLLDLVAKRVDMGFSSYNAFKPYVLSGDLKILGIASPERWDVIPDVPTMAELGYPDVVLTIQFGLVAPTDVPDDVLQKVRTAFVDAAQQQNVQEWFVKSDLQQHVSSSEEFDVFLDQEAKRLDDDLTKALHLK